MSDQARMLVRPSAAWVALASALALSALGVAAIATVNPAYAVTQARWIFVGLAAMVLCAIPHPRHIIMTVYPLMGVCLALLVFLLAPGVPTWLVRPHNGARCWVSLGFFDFEPAEAVKIVFVLALARYLRYRDNYRSLGGMLVPFLLMLVPVVLILKQPDLGTALLMVPTLFVVLVAAGAKLAHMRFVLEIGLLAVLVNVAVIAFDPPRISATGTRLPSSPARAWMHLLKPHQEARIAAILSQAQDDHRYDRSIGYQQQVAKTLIGAGGLEGLGEEHSAAIFRANPLPENHNDMIFTVIANRWGFAGGAGVIALFLVLNGSFLFIAGGSKDPFTRLACVGFAGLTFTQAVINIGMTMGLAPITGITLPFVSYGGSSLLATFAMLGLAINFATRRDSPLARPSFEFEQEEGFRAKGLGPRVRKLGRV